MLDPFHKKYGKVLTAGLSLVSLCLDMFWLPATLTGLGLFHTSFMLTLGLQFLCLLSKTATGTTGNERSLTECVWQEEP